VLRGEAYSNASDVYAFGMVGWELITRQHPFEAEKFSFMSQVTVLLFDTKMLTI
jgi:serine/threonine protein kinase